MIGGVDGKLSSLASRVRQRKGSKGSTIQGPLARAPEQPINAFPTHTLLQARLVVAREAKGIGAIVNADRAGL